MIRLLSVTLERFDDYYAGPAETQKLVMKAFANDVESRPLEPGRSRIIGLAFVKTMNSVVTKILLEYLKGMM